MKNKKKIIIAIVIAVVLAIVAVVVFILMRKEAGIECPVTGVKLGMSCHEVEKILDKEKIEWDDGQDYEGNNFIGVDDTYIELFEVETYMFFDFLNENKLSEIQCDLKYNTIEEREKHEEKLKAYYTKKYGKPKEGEGWDGSYYWYKGDETIHMFYDASGKSLYFMYYAR